VGRRLIINNKGGVQLSEDTFCITFAEMKLVFNEWLRQSVSKDGFISAKAYDGDYGEFCANYFLELLKLTKKNVHES